ncbi:MAG: hypothetical protein IJS17_03605 [Clostridia bacterium]|nr:hypothetical protein [Clostridia bacterium]
MVKTLVKKQLSEIFRAYFYNPKTNQTRSKAAVAVRLALFALVMIVFVGGMFASLAYMLCEDLVSDKMTWLYFAIFSILALALGIFGSVFNTYSGLYLAKDNDLLLSMPIPARHIVFSRLLSVYLMGLMYSSVVMIPAIVVYFIVYGVTVLNFIGCLMILVNLTVIILVLSCALGWVVAKASRRLKNKSLTTVVISLAFVGIYYFAVFNAQNVINDILNNASVYGGNIKKFAYPFYLLGRMGEGKMLPVLTVTLVTAAAAFLTWKIILSTFFDIATSSKAVSKSKSKQSSFKEKSLLLSLVSKEFSYFKSSPTFMLNCGLGTLMIPISAVLILVKGNEFAQMFDNYLFNYDSISTVMICVLLCVAASMNDLTVPSVSLEGKTLWVVQSLPIDLKNVLFAKVSLQLILTVPMLLICEICSIIALKLSFLQSVAVIILPIAYAVSYAMFGLMIGLKRPNLTWTSEITPIKQNMSVIIVMIAGWAYAALIGGAYLLCGLFIDSANYLLAVALITVMPCVLLFRWLKNTGARILSAL